MCGVVCRNERDMYEKAVPGKAGEPPDSANHLDDCNRYKGLCAKVRWALANVKEHVHSVQ